jgi:pimeloyl-ACP methyl ester carboxylesterase
MPELLKHETIPAEGSRYEACLVFVPGLWAGPRIWWGFASFLAHRGWECQLLDVSPLADLAARTAAVAEYAAALPVRPVLIGHDAGALIALAAAPGGNALAAVLVAPLLPGSGPVRALTLGVPGLLRTFLGRPVPAPRQGGVELPWGGLPATVRTDVERTLGPEPAAVIRELARGRTPPRPAGVPTLLLAGDRDPLLPSVDRAALAQLTGADSHILEGMGHWPLAGPGWQTAVAAAHRWLVQRLGASLLTLYEEAMAERDAEEGGEE